MLRLSDAIAALRKVKGLELDPQAKARLDKLTRDIDAQAAPQGMAFPVEASSDLVLMLHMRPSGKPEVVHVSVGLYFSATPPTRVPALLRLTRQDLDIPAGERHAVVTSSYTLPVDIDVFTVQPHAHYLARQIEGFARLPDGSTRWLLLIKNWDFNWQDVYRYTAPVSLPAGTTVVMRWRSSKTIRNSPL